MKHLLSKHPYLYLLCAGLLCTVSCKKILTESPKAIADVTFYNTSAEIETAVNAIYEPLRNLNGICGTLGAQLEAYSDWNNAVGSYLILKDYQGLNSTNISRTDEGWRLFYLSIRNANIAIQKIPLASATNAADKTRFLAESRFLRAIDYFWLVRNWGGVPIRTESTLDQPNVKRGTSDDVYNLILSDLTAAEANLPEKQTQIGRATKWAAKAALAEVYFTRGMNTEARDKANEIIQSGQFSLVPVSTAADFDKLFGPTVVNTTEEIWYLKMSRQLGQGSYLGTFFAYPQNKLHGGGVGFGAFYADTVAMPYHAQWDVKDLRKQYDWLAFDAGVGSPTTIIFRKLFDALAPSTSAAGNDITLYRYADVLLLYAEAASRANNGPTAAALDAINQVHRRAYGKPTALPSTVDFKLTDYNAANFIDLCVKERGYETQGEVKRWLDLKRLGPVKLKQIIKAAFNKDVADKHLLWPIPAAELNFNTALDPTKDQNPGY